MKFGKACLYLASVILIYLLLSGAEIFFVEPLFDLFGKHDWLITAFRILFLLVIDPLLTYLFCEQLPIRPDGLLLEAKKTEPEESE